MPPEVAAPPRRSLQATYAALLAHVTERRADAGPAPLPEATALVAGDERASAGERIHVYQHMYRARIVEALEAQFPRLARWLGADAFAEVAAAYVADEPSRHPSLRFIGQRLAEWLATRAADFPNGLALARPALPDLARLEWAREDVFDAVDQPTLALDAVRGWPADRFGEIPLRLVAAHRRLRLARPVAAVWGAIGDAHAALDAGAVSAAAVRTGGESLLVWRQGIAVFHRATDDTEAAALDLIADGTTLGAICEALCRARSEEEATAQAFSWLSTWTADELLLAV